MKDQALPTRVPNRSKPPKVAYGALRPMGCRNGVGYGRKLRLSVWNRRGKDFDSSPVHIQQQSFEEPDPILSSPNGKMPIAPAFALGPGGDNGIPFPKLDRRDVHGYQGRPPDCSALSRNASTAGLTARKAAVDAPRSKTGTTIDPGDFCSAVPPCFSPKTTLPK